ncbi:MAG: RDD family protein [Thiolinea sp.]
MRLDTTYTVNTPEGIALQLSPAGPVPRTLAWLVDLSIRGAITLFIFLILAFMGNLGFGLALILVFLLEWFYPVWFELRHEGQTPGKKLLQIYVANLDASPVSPAASIVRNLLRVIDFLPFLYGFGLASTLMTRRFQRLGDLAANTVVLHRRQQNGLIHDFDDPPQRPDSTLTLPEQQAIILFAQRRHTLTDERQQELAGLCGPLTRQQADPAGVMRGIASWLTGRKA